MRNKPGETSAKTRAEWGVEHSRSRNSASTHTGQYQWLWTGHLQPDEECHHLCMLPLAPQPTTVPPTRSQQVEAQGLAGHDGAHETRQTQKDGSLSPRKQASSSAVMMDRCANTK